MEKLNLAQKQALQYLQNIGYKNVTFRKKTPCFSTDHGYFEARHGYLNKLGDIIILLTFEQKKEIKSHDASILVFVGNGKDADAPFDIVKSFELDQIRARRIVFHDVETSNNQRVFTRLTEVQCVNIVRLVQKGEFEDMSSFLRIAATQLLQKHEQASLV